MSIACDYCLKVAEKHEEAIFVASPSGLVHICDGCIELAMATVKEKRELKEDV